MNDSFRGSSNAEQPCASAEDVGSNPTPGAILAPLGRCDVCRRPLKRYGKAKKAIKGDPRRPLKSCGPCTVTKKIARNKAALVASKGGCCERCGYDRCLAALTFHHSNPKQKGFTIARRMTRKLSSLLLEAEKCVLLCANCHAEEHAGEHRFERGPE